MSILVAKLGIVDFLIIVTSVVNLEVRAFKAMENKNQKLAIKLVHSDKYYEAKQKIMLPIDEMLDMLHNRTNMEVTILNEKIHHQFTYILIIGILFILGNVVIYILLRKKVNNPIEYLTQTIDKIQKNEIDIEKKIFYDDEIGETIEEFFLMKKQIETKTKDLKKQLKVVTIAERKQEQLFKELDDEKNFINTIMDSQENFVITSDGKCLKTANKAFFDFYDVKDVDEFMEKFGDCICDTFDTDAPKEYIQKTMGDEKWLTYVYNRPAKIHKARINRDGKDYIFTITSEKLTIEGEEIKTAIFTDITVMEEAKQQIEAIHKHTRESIEYASLIQGALIPQSDVLNKFFKDDFVIWHPKDTVGGDIWLFNELRHEDECLLLFIDCTGHGVPGAFVTMIVKAIEREIISMIQADRYHDIDVSPSWIMSYFNKTMKVLLKQETKESMSNAGWDGGVIYYNRRTQILKFAGAETPLFYMTKDGEFNTIKGNRYSVGYKKCAMDYEYKETIINVEEGMKFYCTTDGYLDQNGGEKDFPFGKKRFGNIIKEHHTETMADQKERFLYEMDEYETMIPNNDRNDDMTVIGFEIGEKSEFKEDIIEEIVKYEGVMTQNVIASAMDNIEVKITNMGMMGTVSTITIEYCQNMMNYSKNEEKGSRQIVPAGEIEVQYYSNKESEYYEIRATNIVAIEDKEKIEPKLIEIQGLDKVGIKKRYRELRKSGQNTHEKGGGIGMYEIAKVSDSIEYEFVAINEDKYRFTMTSFVKPKVKEKEVIL